MSDSNTQLKMAKEKLFTKDFLTLTISNFLMAVAFYFVTPIMALFMIDTFDSSKDEVGFVMFAFSIAAIISRPFSGFLLDSQNRYIVYLLSFVLFTTSFLGYPIASSFMFLLLLRFYHGVTWGAVSTAGNTLAVDLISESRRGEGIGIFGLSMTVAMAIGPAIAMSMTPVMGYNKLFYAAVAFCLFGLILALFIKSPKTQHRKRPFSFSSLFNKQTFPIALNVMLTQIPYGGIISFAALYGREIGVLNSSMFFVILSAGILFSRVISGRIFDRVGPRNVMAAGILMVVISLVSLGLFANSFGFHSTALILGVGFGIISPTFQAMANKKIEPAKRGAVNSTYLTFFDTGVGIGMLIFGVLFELVGYAETFYLSSVIQIVALIVFLIYTMPKYNARIAE